MKRICILPGDGIGPEVVECAVRVLEALGSELRFERAQIGQSAVRSAGDPLPEDTLELVRSCDSSLMGAVTSSEDKGYRSPVLRLRKELDLYANLRPVRNLVSSTRCAPIDVVIVRENTEGMYTQHEVEEEGGVTTHRRVTKAACERIVRFAIRHAKDNGRKRVCCVHKSNVLKVSDGLFVDTFRELMGSEGEGLAADEQLVDSAAMKLVTEPGGFDTIVTLNLYGDILSDVAAGVAGGLGFAPSGNIGPRYSVFEPAHGSAPGIAGKGVANPTAAILAGSMMLRHIGMPEEGRRVAGAVSSVYSQGHLTQDIGGRHGSKLFTDHVVEELGR